MDSYFVISGVPTPTVDHADRILNLAIGMLMEAKQITVPKLGLPIMVQYVKNTLLAVDFSCALAFTRDRL